MTAKLIRILVFALVLLPSARFVWVNRDMPQFAYLHDDGILFTSAKSVALGQGYRIQSMPEQPSQTKQPPLYPLLLSLVWMINPTFPDNLVLASAVAWTFLGISLGLAGWYFKQNGFSEPQVWIMLALLGLNPYTVLFGSTMFSEIPFTCLVIATLLFARQYSKVALAATIAAAACAYLTRTAGVVLFLTVPLLWWMQKRDQWLQRSISFWSGVLPFALVWPIWAALHRPVSMDETMSYYVDYMGYQFLNVDLSNFAVVLWKNADQILYGMGALALPKIADALPLKLLTQVIGVAMIAGVGKLFRKNLMRDYALFAIGSVLILLVWHFPTTERFVLPLYPLLLAGLIAELTHLTSLLKKAIRHQDMGQRVAAAGFGTAVGALLLCALGVQAFMTFYYLNQTANQQRSQLTARRSAYQWMDANLPASATVLSYDDPLLYLYTARRGNYLPLLPRWWYAEDHQSMQRAYRDLPDYCRRRGLQYVFFTDHDLSRETGAADQEAISKLVHSNPDLIPIYNQTSGTVFRVRTKHP